MPAPDPDGLDCYKEDRRWYVTAQVWPSSGFLATGNRRHRLARAKAILRKLTWGGWCCRACGGPVPIWRRADAVYCSTGCRKRAMRGRNR